MKKTFEVLPVGAALQDGDFYPQVPHPDRIGTRSMGGMLQWCPGQTGKAICGGRSSSVFDLLEGLGL